MAIDWTAYDSFAWSKAKQSPMDDGQKAAIAQCAADILALAADERQQAWGQASPPGRFAATVIRVPPGVAHAFKASAAEEGIDEIGLKLFKTTRDAEREAAKVLVFHMGELKRLPGIPNPLVQRSLAAGMYGEGTGRARGYVVQEWVQGATLEDWLRTCWPIHPPDGDSVCNIIEQLFDGIIIPLWHAGTVWWDIRDANFCYCEQRQVLRMIDVDSLGAYAREILGQNGRWDAREKGRATALARLRRACVRLLCAQADAPKGRIENALHEAWASILEPELRLLGIKANGDRAARAALGAFIGALKRMRLDGCAQ
ncbi:MAG: hypothetical protein JOY64_04545 [Alphaproteobacteria bacterium]|nr:hypothetical protein [Alphaproteobacteria bacterium]